jgi:O-antigen/teichoic acid export membrane protein
MTTVAPSDPAPRLGPGLAIELAKKGVVYGLGASLNGVVAFLLLPFIVHRLDSFEYGRYALAELLLNLLLVICGLGLGSALLARYGKLEERAQRELVGSVLGLVLVATLVVLAMFALFAWLLGPYVFPELRLRHYVLVAAIAACESVWLVFAAMYRARGAAWRYIALQLVQVAISLGLTIELIAHRGYREDGLLVGRLAADGAVLLLLGPELVRYRPRALTQAWDLVRVGGPLVLAAFSAMFVAMSPRIFLDHLGDASLVGSFAVDARLASIVSIGFVQPFGLVYVAAIVPIARRADARRVFARAATFYIALGGLATLAVGLAAPWIAHTLGKSQFPISPTAILVLAAANVAAGLIYPLTIGPYVLERTREVIPVYVGAAVLAIAAGWIAIANAGILGAACALVAVYVAQGVALAVVSQRMYPVPFEWRRVAVLAAAFAGAVTAVVSLGPR